jgi:AraC-like DNA-binding protein
LREEPGVTIGLTAAQVAQVAREASGQSGSLLAMFARLEGPDARRAIASTLNDSRLSHSTLRALEILASFPSDGTAPSLADVADQLGYSRSTTHRYLTTWMVVAFLEQEPRTRRDRRTTPQARGGTSASA